MLVNRECFLTTYIVQEWIVLHVNNRKEKNNLYMLQKVIIFINKLNFPLIINITVLLVHYIIIIFFKLILAI